MFAFVQSDFAVLNERMPVSKQMHALSFED